MAGEAITQSQNYKPPLFQFTHLGRTLDPNSPTNRAIIGLTVVAGLIGGGLALLRGLDLLLAVGQGVSGAAAVFLAWAITREIDPDHDIAALAAAPLALVAYLLAGASQLLVVAVVMIAARLIARTTGLAARLTDILLWGGVALMAVAGGQWLALPVIAAAVLLDVLLPQPNRRNGIAGLTILIGAALIVVVLVRPEITPPTREVIPLILAVFFTGGLVYFYRLRTVRVLATGDVTGKPLHPARVRAAGWLAAGSIGLALIWYGLSGLVYVSPVLAAGVGSMLVYGWEQVSPRA